MPASTYIRQLDLLPHPEGGYYKETYRSGLSVATAAGTRSASTAIYFLLQQGDYSAFHRIKSDECWHFYAGGPLLVHIIDPQGSYSCVRLGPEDQFQLVVPAGAWFASEPAAGSEFALVGCTVAPGFDFADFEMAEEDQICAQFPQHRGVILRLCR